MWCTCLYIMDIALNGALGFHVMFHVFFQFHSPFFQEKMWGHDPWTEELKFQRLVAQNHGLL